MTKDLLGEEISLQSIYKYYQHFRLFILFTFYKIAFRNIVSFYFQQFMPMITLPGPVEIDECHIGARVRGKFGRPPAPGKIVFGIKCRTTGIVLLFRTK